MTQTKGFTIFARAWTASSPRKMVTVPTPPLSPRSEDQQSIESAYSDLGTETPGSISSTTTISTELSDYIKPTIRRKINFSALESLFAQESSTDTPSSSSLWYILTTALLLAFHKEKLIGDLWTYLSSDPETGDEELLAIARRIREACLKASTLVGFPRAINALLTLQRAIEATHPSLSIELQADSSLRSSASLTASDKYARGMRLFENIYAKHTPRVLSAMSSCSGGDLTHFAINCIYGELLAEDSIIGDLETGLLEFVCCLADGVAPQAKGHFFGSINLGATRGMLRAAVGLTEEIAGLVRVGCPWKELEDWVDEEYGGIWKGVSGSSCRGSRGMSEVGGKAGAS